MSTPSLKHRAGSALQTIGWKEVIHLPEWGVRSLLAKADTGARGSALDVSSMRRVPGNKVEFTIVLDRKNRGAGPTVVADIVRSSRIRSSNGVVQERFVVRTSVQIGTRKHPVEFSLVNRQRMICRALLGRHALAGRYLVDSSDKYVHGPRRKPRAT
ncbi:ATP-dependent zinc protease family protein [Coraliomargarita parva]|uniref:ATP-dependent zinc protease family protein n=1 Tax=Coraliomargarita parva TaxID=3014050 RepID=UPI0022B3D04B|nr:RimK/LysX family protein [Coraliomargarita parva]